MDHYDRFGRGSDRHKAMVNPDGLHLAPIDNTKEAIDRFQSVVNQVYAHEGDGYEVVIVRSNQQYPFDLCVAMLLNRQADEYGPS
jgi:hypothetical protein